MAIRRARMIFGIAWMAFGAALIVTPAAAAEWSKAKGDKLRSGCTLECGVSVDPKHKPKCPAYCGCITDEAQKMMTEAEYDDMDQKIRIPNTYNPKLPEFTALIPLCNKRTWP